MRLSKDSCKGRLTGSRLAELRTDILLQRGGERFVSVVIANQSTESYTVNAAPLNRDRSPAVILPLKNKGSVHFPLNARMTLSDAEGHRVRFVAGYGRWLLPGDSTELRFRMKDAIPAGRYTLRIQIDTKEGLAPVEITTPVELTQ